MQLTIGDLIRDETLAVAAAESVSAAPEPQAMQFGEPDPEAVKRILEWFESERSRPAGSAREAGSEGESESEGQTGEARQTRQAGSEGSQGSERSQGSD
jgi:hypothetical protein